MATIRARSKVSFTRGAPAKDPMFLFDIEGLEIDTGSFLSDLLPTFACLEWDYYDVRREQSDIIRRAFTGSQSPELEPLLLEYYRGALSLDDLRTKTKEIPYSASSSLCAVKPYRQRSTAVLRMRRDGTRWGIERAPKRPVAQNVPATDYRSVERVFPETDSSVVEHPHFCSLISRIADLVSEVQTNVRQLELISWQTSITATNERAGSNSPEGIHQDGSDYIVSALVLERNNIRGGESRIFAPDKSTQHFGVTLQPGQGILQADKGSQLWHDVTPICVDDPSKGAGTRKIFGFDINVVETA